MNAKPRYTPREVAKLYGVSAPTVIEWVEGGLLNAVNFATANATRRRWRITADDLARFEKSRCNTTSSEVPK